MGISKSDYGTTQAGQPVDLYTLTNVNGLVAKISNYGGTVTELWVPDRDGTMAGSWWKRVWKPCEAR